MNNIFTKKKLTIIFTVLLSIIMTTIMLIAVIPNKKISKHCFYLKEDACKRSTICHWRDPGIKCAEPGENCGDNYVPPQCDQGFF